MKKILVLGAPGSGKSFCASELGKKLNIPVYPLDFYYYKPNWKVVDSAEFAAKQREIMRHEKWIIDGNSVRMLSERLTHADTVIFLDIPKFFCILRILWRDCNPFKKNTNLPPGCTFSFKQFLYFLIQHVVKFNKRNTILQIIAQHPQVTFFHLHSSKELDDFLKTV
jgi:adenylate kinase family enzyme